MLLEGADAVRACEAVDAIAADLARLGAQLADASLAQGDAGLALFFHAAGDAVRASFHLERAAASLGELDASLYRGVGGVAFVVELLGGGLDASVDEALLELAEDLPAYDLVDGLTGLGVYALERGARGVPLLQRVVELLASRAVDGSRWLSEPALLGDGQPAEGYYNLGVAHGIGGVRAFLGYASRTVPEARELELRARRWMQEQRANGFPAYPSLVGIEDAERRQLRCGWCHGDPGLAAAWIGAACAAGDAAWEEEAVGIAHGLIGRSAQELGIDDAGLCHGAAGLAHLFLRIHQATADPLFAAEAKVWFGRALDLRRPATGVGGFRAGAAETPFADDPGFLGGAAGIGLALLAAVGRAEPAWDRLLLVSSRG